MIRTSSRELSEETLVEGREDAAPRTQDPRIATPVLGILTAAPHGPQVRVLGPDPLTEVLLEPVRVRLAAR